VLAWGCLGCRSPAGSEPLGPAAPRKRVLHLSADEKRGAFFVTGVFLRPNGWKIRVDAADAHAFLIGLLERGECDFDHLVGWLRTAVVPR
jgi:hypothetical protein